MNVSRLLLLGALVVSGFLVAPAAADAAPCYWSATRNNTVSLKPAWYIRHYNTVEYRIGYTCTGAPTHTKVIRITGTSYIDESWSWVRHYVGWFHLYKNNTTSLYSWRTADYDTCVGVCRLSLTKYPYVTMSYSRENHAYVYCKNCSAVGANCGYYVNHYFTYGGVGWGWVGC